MAVRATMADLISEVRTLIADPAGASQQFGDQVIQNALDRRREDVVQRELAYDRTRTASGYAYKTYRAAEQHWEANAVLEDSSYAPLTPATSDLITGTWTFAASTPPPVYLTGATFDLYGAAADLLEAWAASVKMEHSFSIGGDSFQRQQKSTHLHQLAGQYRRQQRPFVASLVRRDAW